MKTETPRLFDSYTDDFCVNKEADFKVPDGYVRIRRDITYKLLSALTYGAAICFSWIYLKFGLRIKYKKHARIAPGAFVYCNHTQPVGDVFIPAYAAFPRRIYTVVSPANYALPVIGKIIPYLGAIPTPSSIHDTSDFVDALRVRSEEGHPIIVFPEAHVWEYCSFIRDYPETSFRYPVRFDAPAYAITVVYTRGDREKTKAEIHVDGPFYADSDGNEHQRARKLRDLVLNTMKYRAKDSISHIKYIKKDK